MYIPECTNCIFLSGKLLKIYFNPLRIVWSELDRLRHKLGIEIRRITVAVYARFVRGRDLTATELKKETKKNSVNVSFILMMRGTHQFPFYSFVKGVACDVGESRLGMTA